MGFQLVVPVDCLLRNAVTTQRIGRWHRRMFEDHRLTGYATSGRRDAPFVELNCAAISLGLSETDLFGHEKGIFAGSHRRKPGPFAQANKARSNRARRAHP